MRELTTYLIDRADELSLQVMTPRRWQERAGIVSFRLAGDLDTIVAQLREKNIVCSVKDGYVRTAVHFYNTTEELEIFLSELTSI